MRVKFLEGVTPYVKGDCVDLKKSTANKLIDENKCVHAPVDEDDSQVLDRMSKDYESGEMTYQDKVAFAYQLAEDKGLEPPEDKKGHTIDAYLEANAG